MFFGAGSGSSMGTRGNSLVQHFAGDVKRHHLPEQSLVQPPPPPLLEAEASKTCAAVGRQQVKASDQIERIISDIVTGAFHCNGHKTVQVCTCPLLNYGL